MVAIDSGGCGIRSDSIQKPENRSTSSNQSQCGTRFHLGFDPTHPTAQTSHVPPLKLRATGYGKFYIFKHHLENN